MNLIDVIPENEYKKIETYYNRYAIHNYNGKIPMPLYDFLEDWNKSNQKLYHMLGDKLIYKVPYSIKKDNDELKGTIKRYIHYKDKFIDEFDRRMYDKVSQEMEIYENFKYILSFIRNSVLSVNAIFNNGVEEDFIFSQRSDKKPLKIQKGMKIFRAVTKIGAYWDINEETMDKLKVFQNDISMIFNDAIIKGNLCFSIHPLDFMTMSDNNSNWSSCMSWQDDGCYRVGTVEMMNSNNVICCYLESTSGKMNLITKDYLKEHPEAESEQITDFWNDKKWRQLVYVNKDILLAGKAYPYQSEKITLQILDIIKGLLKDNCGWTYTFGPELYNDMNRIDGCFDYQIEKDLSTSAYKHSTPVKKIYIDTLAMYNDMANDHSPIYWCYRNNIRHTKKIRVSGNSKCIICFHNLLEYDDEWSDEYNDRYTPTGSLICNDCKNEYECSKCGQLSLNNLTEIPIWEYGVVEYKKLCPECLKTVYKCSNKNCDHYIFRNTNYYYYDEKLKDSLYSEDFEEIEDLYDNDNDKFFDESKEKIDGPQMLCLCSNCGNQLGISTTRFKSRKELSLPRFFNASCDIKLAAMTIRKGRRYIDELKN